MFFANCAICDRMLMFGETHDGICESCEHEDDHSWMRLLMSFPLDRTNESILNELLVDYVSKEARPKLRKRLNMMLENIRREHDERERIH